MGMGGMAQVSPCEPNDSLQVRHRSDQADGCAVAAGVDDVVGCCALRFSRTDVGHHRRGRMMGLHQHGGGR